MKLPLGVKPLGWYLQQFVKLGVARLYQRSTTFVDQKTGTIDALSENYLVWDADNVLLGGNHELFDPQGRPIMAENGNGRYASVTVRSRVESM